MNLSPSNRLGTLLAGVLAFILLPVSVNAAPPQYIVTDLGTLGGSSSVAQGINASGQVTGYLTLGAGVEHAFLYNGTTMTDLGTLGGNNSKGFGINASGQVTGFSSLTPGGVVHAFSYNGTALTDIDPFSSGSSGFGINTSGQIAGESGGRPVLWTGLTKTDLGSLGLGGGGGGIAQGINDSGQVTGYVNDRAFFYNGTTMAYLSGSAGWASSAGFAINNSGQVAGWFTLSSFSQAHAFFHTGTGVIDLGTLGGSASWGYGVNSSGDVVGMSDITGNTASHGFLYTGGTMYDLNDIVLPGSGATRISINALGNSINDLGQIAATGLVNGSSHALLLTPTPEPSTAVLLIGGVALLGLRRRQGGQRQL